MIRQKIVGISAALAVGFGLAAIAPASAAGFTAEQATAGKKDYDANCAQCHGFKLEGPDAPGLVGKDIMANWDTAGGLFDFISVAMPPVAPGKLGDEAYLNIVSYIMSYNGAQPGDEPMVNDEDKLAAISLVDETAAGPAANAVADAGPVADTNVPQAYTWGKQLPGGPEPVAKAVPAGSSVPQAFTWGKELPTAN
ncbi:mono/diheme cytochrome c family protein [Paenochrobactrum gallinarii]|uniref:Mono/diheme cytochrome c family protein n=1 Tax=Paenochrobactrum gallinarii TaxID=643673 RepID=A0A841LUL8_9HYPH|nr:cytochrome c [Paenochrobactrum gallinarii]MBB6262025.1 mono/diheme cytochrome c family protein [Paenochrobactrum gallinarii]